VARTLLYARFKKNARTKGGPKTALVLFGFLIYEANSSASNWNSNARANWPAHH